MTQSSTPTQAAIRLPLPQDRVIYHQLPTDFYPWTEVVTDLEHSDQEFTAVLDIQEETRWARFIWMRGELLGGIGAGGRDVALDVAMRALPQATVTLTRVEPLVSDILWSCRTTQPKPLDLTWPAAYDQLDRERFRGALISKNTCSFWDGGRVVTGTMPQSGMPCLIIMSGANLERSALVEFWQEMISLTHHEHPELDHVWREVSMQLSGEHPSLDPFVRDIIVSKGRLKIDDSLSMFEMRSALLAAYQSSLIKLKVKLSDLPVTHMQQRPAWAAAGLEAST